MRAVIADLSKGLDVVGQVVATGEEEVQPFYRRTHRGLMTRVITHVAVGGVEVVIAAGQADVAAHIYAAAEAGRLETEGAG
ncbi:hypothetical protein D3C81_1855120 [compost metagenome]